MDMTLRSCRDFSRDLASASPTPGGGGASALAGALGSALGQMVCNLTLGKKKYAAVEPQIQQALEKLEKLRLALLDCVQEDEEAFAPLAAAYAIDKNDPNRAQVLEKATLIACEPPMKILRLCAEALSSVAFLAENGSRLAVSDAGCAASFLRCGMESASLNIFINTRTLLDRETAKKLEQEAEELLSVSVPLAEKIFSHVKESLGG